MNALNLFSHLRSKLFYLLKNLDIRFQEIGYILHIYFGICKLIGGIFFKYKEIRLIEI